MFTSTLVVPTVAMKLTSSRQGIPHYTGIRSTSNVLDDQSVHSEGGVRPEIAFMAISDERPYAEWGDHLQPMPSDGSK